MRAGLYAFLIFLIFHLNACTKNEHQIRFQNNYSETIKNVQVGAVMLSDVSPGQTSEYKVIPEGDFKITGFSANGYLEGSGSVSGKGLHQWSIVLNADKALTLIHDKKK